MADSVGQLSGGVLAANLRLIDRGDGTYSLAVAPSGDDRVNGVQKVEGRFTATQRTTSGQVRTGVGLLHTAVASATTDSVVNIYDNTSATGTPILTIRCAAGRTEPVSALDAAYVNGIHVQITGTCEVTVSYR
jgi:hypothetical protein